ncbi:HNH endonuclease [Gordonia phage Petra]|uniref:HNH endonuclease n=2 Tax=root TaxID=1 RepID=A0A2U8UKJ4_9CAUD|nr:HNH endonuclease [Gordonia westfalica]YP_010095468.1 HNH endonuclease [Gordonia phage Petra]AWN04187.1 HNH endonuclease [Gordonia phage Petra]SDU64891.1 HNH endonuclease [Gordonia westfalica]
MAHRPKISMRVRLSVYERDGYRCQYCGLQFEPCPSPKNAPWTADDPYIMLELDHVIPRAIGGSDDIDNLRAACSPCNRRKATYVRDEQWAERIQKATAVLQGTVPSRECAEKAISELVGRKFTFAEIDMEVKLSA